MSTHCLPRLLRRVTCLTAMLAFAANLSAQPWFDSTFFATKRPNNFYDMQEAFNKYWEGKTPGRGVGYKPFRRWEHYMESRVDANGDWDPEALWNGWKEKNRLFGVDSPDDADWVHIGPVNIPQSGGGMGRLNCVSFHPTNPNTVWVGSASGGAWVSTDNGLHWTTMTDDLPLLGVSGIAIDYSNPSRIWIATGDGDASDTYSIGVLMSTDNGNTWNTTGLSYAVTSSRSISRLIQHRTDPNFLMAATSIGIQRSTNAGAVWQLSGNTSTYKDLEEDIDEPNTWYAAQNSSGIRRSTDNGVSWVTLTSGLPSTGIGRVAVAVTPADPDMIYGMFANSSSGYLGLYRSTDNGDTWELRSSTPNLLNGSLDGSGTTGQAWYDMSIAVSPTDPNLVFVGGVNIWKSTNGGQTWTMTAHWYGANGIPYVHADIHALEYHNSALYTGCDGGIFFTTNSGASWTDRSAGLAISQFYKLGVSAQSPNMILAGAQDNGTDYFALGAWRRVVGGDGGECLIDYSNPNFMYAEWQNGNLQRSTNGGASWNDIATGMGSESRAWVAPIIINPFNPQSLYRTSTKVYKSTNRGVRWDSISVNLNGTSTINNLVIAPSDTMILYATAGSRMYRSSNSGVNWTQLSGLPNGVSHIAVHPSFANEVWVVYANYTAGTKVYYSPNGGSTWVNQSTGLPNLPVNCVAVNPLHPEQVYIGTDVGCFVSSTGGGNWQNFSNGMPAVEVSELEIHPVSEVIVASTFGRGLWLSPLEMVSVREHQQAAIVKNLKLDVFPNPFNAQSELKLTIPQRGDYEVAIFNVLGGTVQTIHKGVLEAGTQTFQFQANNLATGLYFARVKSNGTVMTSKLLLLR